jgi:hypothetical protein
MTSTSAQRVADHIGALAHVEPERVISVGDGIVVGAIWSHGPVVAEVAGRPLAASAPRMTLTAATLRRLFEHIDSSLLASCGSPNWPPWRGCRKTISYAPSRPPSARPRTRACWPDASRRRSVCSSVARCRSLGWPRPKAFAGRVISRRRSAGWSALHPASGEPNAAIDRPVRRVGERPVRQRRKRAIARPAAAVRVSTPSFT